MLTTIIKLSYSRTELVRIDSRYQLKQLAWTSFYRGLWLIVPSIVILSLIIMGFKSTTSRPTFKITHTEVSATLNQDRSATLKQTFTYQGRLAHGPAIQIESGGADNMKVNSVSVKRKGKLIHDQLASIGQQPDTDDLEDLLEDIPNAYGYVLENGKVHLMINDPLKSGQTYTINVNVTEPNVISKTGVVKWNLLGHANQTDLGSVKAYIKNNAKGKVHSFYVQGVDGVLAHGSKLNQTTVIIKHYYQRDHLDLRTNMPYAKAVFLTQLLHIWNNFGLNWIVLALLIAYFWYWIRQQMLGSSMAIPDIIIDNLPGAIYLSNGYFNRRLVAGLLTKRELLHSLQKAGPNKAEYNYFDSTSSLERIILKRYDTAAESSNDDDKRRLINSDADFKSEYPVTTSLAKRLKFLAGLAIIPVLFFLTIELGFKSGRMINIIYWLTLCFVCIAYLLFWFYMPKKFKQIQHQTQHDALVRLANGLSDVKELEDLHLDNAALWTDLVAWAVGIGLNKKIIKELGQRGYDLGLLEDPDQIDTIISSFSGNLDSSFAISTSSDGDSSGFGGDSFGGGDAGGDSGAGGW